MPDDRRLARRLARDVRVSALAQARVQDLHARAVRRREEARARARRALPVRATVALGAGMAAFPLEDVSQAGAVLVMWAAGLGAVSSVRKLRRPPIAPLPAITVAPAPAPLPDRRSAAWPAVRRLEAVRLELSRLLPLVSPAGRAAADEAWEAAAEADAALRWQAARLAAVEPHRGADPDLLRPLYDGVECQERLVSAVADLVAASADPLAAGRLQDATDRLHGLAQGLREVR